MGNSGAAVSEGFNDIRSERERGGQARGFNAEEMDGMVLPPTIEHQRKHGSEIAFPEDGHVYGARTAGKQDLERKKSFAVKLAMAILFPNFDALTSVWGRQPLNGLARATNFFSPARAEIAWRSASPAVPIRP